MVTSTNPHALAVELIAVMQCRAGHGMPLTAARIQFGILRTDEFLAAATYAEENGWIELKRNGFWLVVTGEGIATSAVGS